MGENEEEPTNSELLKAKRQRERIELRDWHDMYPSAEVPCSGGWLSGWIGVLLGLVVTPLVWCALIVPVAVLFACSVVFLGPVWTVILVVAASWFFWDRHEHGEGWREKSFLGSSVKDWACILGGIACLYVIYFAAEFVFWLLHLCFSVTLEPVFKLLFEAVHGK